MKNAASLLACLLLAACGQKGDLYMPDSARPVVVPASPTPATGDATTDQDDDQPRQQQGAAGNAAGN